MKLNRKPKQGIAGKWGEPWYRMMAESAFADVLGNPGPGTLVLISSDQTFQTPPPTSSHACTGTALQGAGCRWKGLLAGSVASWKRPGPPVWSGASLL